MHVSEDSLLNEIRQARNERDNAQERYSNALRQAVKQGISARTISTHAGISADAIRMYIRRKGWR